VADQPTSGLMSGLRRSSESDEPGFVYSVRLLHTVSPRTLLREQACGYVAENLPILPRTAGRDVDDGQDAVQS